MATDIESFRTGLLLSEHTERFGSDELVVIEPNGPTLTVDTTLRQAARGRGQVICVAGANEVVCVATSRGYLLRYHWDEYGNEKVHEVEVVKAGPDAQLVGMWLDPTANHIILNVRTQGVHEVQYLHKRWPRARALGKLRGTNLTALAWPQVTDADLSGEVATHPTITGAPPALTATCTGSMLLGTDTGLIHELCIEEPGALRKDPGPPRQLLDLKDRRKSITGLFQGLCQDGGLVVVVATPLAMYVFRGRPGDVSLEDVVAPYTHLPLQPALEAVLPTSPAPQHQPRLPPSQLQVYCPPEGSTDNIRFGWLVGSCVYHGELVTSPLGDVTGTRDQLPAPDALIQGVCALPLLNSDTTPSSPQVVGTPGAVATTLPDLAPDEQIRSMIMTEWHFILLVGDRLRAINRVSGRCAAERMFQSPLLAKTVSGELSLTLDGLALDPVTRTIYVYSDESLYEVQMRQETQGLWRVFQELQDWDAALAMCSSTAQRDSVHNAKAEAAFAAQDYHTAAVHFAKVMSGQPRFEDIALRLMEAEATEALMVFLTTRLSCLSRADRAQSTMLAAWILELQLDALNKILLQSGGVHTPDYTAAEAQLHDFLTKHVEVLDAGTCVGLLACAGRTQELLVYASARADHAAVLEALLQRPDGAVQALAVLRKPSCPAELVYRFAPGLITAAPDAFVDLIIATRPPLEPRRLIPALLRFTQPGASPSGRAAVLRYIAYTLDGLGSTDSAVHDLAAALYSLEEGEAGLLAYIARARNVSGGPLYDTKYVLRLAAERGKRRCEVKLLCELGMYEDAVQHALQVDLALAQSVAGSPPEEEVQLRHRLWLAVAQHVVQGAASSPGDASGQSDAISKAVQLLKEAGGMLKIEDVLPFFPDFATIDNFKDAICDSLERYNKQIDELKSEMEEATEIAEAVRRDLKLIGSRAALVHGSQACARCGQPISDPPAAAATLDAPSGGALPPFFLFPTGLAYHTACCAAEVLSLAPPASKTRLMTLMTRLANMKDTNGADTTQSLLRQLQQEVAGEDPRNGGLLVRLVDMPYLTPADADEQESWVV